MFRAEKLRGGLMVAAAPHRERRAVLSSALCDSDRARGNGMELCQGKGSWGLGMGSAPESDWALEQAAQGSDHGGHGPRRPELKKLLTVLTDIGLEFW